jgi:hypothetical protein
MPHSRACQLRAARRCAFCFVALGGGVVAAAPKLQAVGEASVGYTDNVRTTPDSAGLGQTPRSSGAFITGSPRLVLALDSARATQRVVYRYEYDLFFSQSNASSSTNQLDYRALFELSESTTLTVGSGASETNRYAAVAFAAPGSGVVTALPAGAGAFLQGGADETLSFDLAVGWRAWQGAAVLATTPILGTQAPRTTELTGRAGVERSFLRDSAGFEARSDYTVVHDSVRSDGTPAGVQELLVVNGAGQWRRDIGRYLTSRVEAGAARVQRLEAGRGFWSPVALTALSFADVSGDAQLSYAHNVSSNALLGQSLLSDEIRMRGALSLGAHDLIQLAATAGYQRGRLIDEDATLAAHVNVAMLDVMLGWQATQHLQLALRYQHIDQRSDASTPSLPVSFIQNSVLLGAIVKFPAERDMPRAYRAPERVDRADELRDGLSPATDLQRPGSISGGSR